MSDRVEYPDGTIVYYDENGNRHRTDGPAVEWRDGSRFWFQNDMLHRVGAPAIEYADGRTFNYVLGHYMRN